jgi:hypothetical protein
MTTLALSAPVTAIAGGPNSGTVLPATETSMASNAGFSFPNNGATLVRIVIGSAGAGNVTFNFQRTVEGQLPAAFVVALSNSTTYIFGPFPPSDFNDANGLVQALLSVPTGNSVGVYSLPGKVS